ncbi:MAG TPA: 4-alpha-glucanotransferase [Thermoanaerobaculia bacterium]|nr:4-alpha-glucanotransferase [Thermoanaerobaculia bacterium]
MAPPLSPELRELALRHSIQLSYRDASGRKRRPGRDALLAALRCLGAPVESDADIASALRERRAEACRRGLEPVTVWWERGPFLLRLRRSRADDDAPVRFRLASEDGIETGLASIEAWDRPLPDHDGTRWYERIFRFPKPRIAFGYHTIRVEWGGAARETFLLHAPERAWSPPSDGRMWGLFAPLYGVRSRRDWGVGDLSDLATLIREVSGLGGAGVATLPLLSTFLSEPFEPSPYAPVSRLFWNELYLDPERIREFATSERARALASSAGVRDERERLRSLELVDYRGAMALKRRVLEALADEMLERNDPQRAAEMAEFIADHPRVEAYARFRAALENGRRPGEPPAGGLIELRPEEERARRYHLYVQWQCVRQLESVSALARSSGFGLYLDFPLGVHGGGFDCWVESGVFAKQSSAGAPPDPFFTAGQNWGFPPLHPEQLRETRYRYLIESLRVPMRYAGVLRFDHVMALHRLYWIPGGMPASEGIYVRYRAEEHFAILAIESHRNRTMVVGEDLGTVPANVRARMERHGVRRMWVLQYEIGSGGHVNPPPRGSVASLNTHDMPPFAGFWEGMDIAERARHGHVEDVEEEERKRRATTESLESFLRGRELLRGPQAEARAVHDASLEFMARSEADLVLENAEDLWLAREAQNVPGTHEEHPNWRRKLARPLEDLVEDQELAARLRRLDQWRREGRAR